jgi:hypothetical protein
MAEWTPELVEAHLRVATAGPAGDRSEPLSWLDWLEPEDAQVVQARVAGAPWKLICWRFGIGRATAHRRWTYGLAMIAWRPSGKPVPASWSRRRFLGEAKASQGL